MAPIVRPGVSTRSATSLFSICGGFASEADITEAIAALTAAELERLLRAWVFLARPDQLPPPANGQGAPWTRWLVLGGCGAGKTRTGAEWVRGVATGQPEFGLPARRSPTCARL